jgi:hydrogenase nickel incorporation protein HypA/HybF
VGVNILHELSLCQHVIDIITQQAAVQHYRCVKKICFEIGVLANVEKSVFMFSFDVAAQDTIAEGALLEFIDIPAQSVCKACGQTVLAYQWFDTCSLCGCDQLTVQTGDEFRIKTLEVE